MAISDNFIASFQNTNSLEKPTKRLWVVIFQIKREAVLRHQHWETEEAKIRIAIHKLANDNLLCRSFSQVKWKMVVKNFNCFREKKKKQFTRRSN